jgi:hypothetical protein
MGDGIACIDHELSIPSPMAIGMEAVRMPVDGECGSSGGSC